MQYLCACSYSGARNQQGFMDFIEKALAADKGFARIASLDTVASLFPDSKTPQKVYDDLKVCIATCRVCVCKKIFSPHLNDQHLYEGAAVLPVLLVICGKLCCKAGSMKRMLLLFSTLKVVP